MRKPRTISVFLASPGEQCEDKKPRIEWETLGTPSPFAKSKAQAAEARLPKRQAEGTFELSILLSPPSPQLARFISRSNFVTS